MHGHGGILVEHCKNLGAAWDIRPGDRLLQFTTTAWMMWNALVRALLLRASIVMLDGDPAWPGPVAPVAGGAGDAADAHGAQPGVPDGLPQGGAAAGARPRTVDRARGRHRRLAAAGEGYDYVYEQLGPDVCLVNGSGGTDVCSGIVSGCPMLPVVRGEIAGRSLAVDTAAYDLDGREVVGELGELVIRRPMPSMPVRFWDDPDGARYRAAYFDAYPGVWRQGDWVRFIARGHVRDLRPQRRHAQPRRRAAGHQRALRRGGGAARGHGQPGRAPGGPGGRRGRADPVRGRPDLDDGLRARIAGRLREQLSPRHVPDTIAAVPAIPRTLTGKKLEAPVKRILRGAPADSVASRGALADPRAIDAFVALADGR